MTKLYYTPPHEDIFNEVKKASMELWKLVDSDHDKYGYATEKINKIKDIKNVSDNFMYMVAMFDSGNQGLLASKLSEASRLAIRERMIDGGNPSYLIPF
jgi:hypothetical protein